MRRRGPGGGSLTLDDVTVSGGHAKGGDSAFAGGGAGMGGAIFNMQGSLTVTNSTLTANTAIGGSDSVSDHGKGIAGAVFNMQGSLTVTNSTLTANTAIGGSDSVSDHGKGIAGAVFNLNGDFTATSATFASNGAGYFASQLLNVAYDAQSPHLAKTTLYDSIVANGVGTVPGVTTVDLATDRSAYLPAGLTNHASDGADVSHRDLVHSSSTSIATGESGTITGPPFSTADPQLRPLQFNGGPGMATMALGSGSPAVAAGSDCPGIDERGVVRPAGLCDLGAYQRSAAQLSGLRVSPRRFSLAGRIVHGRCVKPTGKNTRNTRCRRSVRLRISYVLNAAATVTFTRARPSHGRKVKGGCVKQTRKNRRRSKCTRTVKLPGLIVQSGNAGGNRFIFKGGIGGHKLGSGAYLLVATPTGGTPRTITFTIKP